MTEVLRIVYKWTGTATSSVLLRWYPPGHPIQIPSMDACLLTSNSDMFVNAKNICFQMIDG